MNSEKSKTTKDRVKRMARVCARETGVWGGISSWGQSHQAQRASTQRQKHTVIYYLRVYLPLATALVSTYLLPHSRNQTSSHLATTQGGRVARPHRHGAKVENGAAPQSLTTPHFS